MLKNPKGLNFQSQKAAKNRNSVFLAVTLICFATIIGTISFLILLRNYDYDLKNIIGQTEGSSEVTQESETQQITLSGKALFLFAHISDDKSQIRSIYYVKADLDERIISILPISPFIKVSSGGLETKPIDSFRTLGIQGLGDTAESYVGLKADKYILITDSGLLNALKFLGDLEYKQEEKLSYKSNDLVIDIPRGEQLLSPDTVVRLTKYNSIVYKENPSLKNARVLLYAINSYLSKELAENSEAYFSNLINYVQSDISAVDFADSKSLLEELAKSIGSISVTVTDTLTPENAPSNN